MFYKFKQNNKPYIYYPYSQMKQRKKKQILQRKAFELPFLAKLVTSFYA